MDSLKIEEQIKGLLGLNLGGGVPTPGAPGTSTQSEILTVSSQPAPGAYPRHKEKYVYHINNWKFLFLLRFMPESSRGGGRNYIFKGLLS